METLAKDFLFQLLCRFAYPGHTLQITFTYIFLLYG